MNDGSSVDVQNRLTDNPAAAQRFGRFGYVLPRRPQADLRIDLAGGEQLHEESQVGPEWRANGERLQPLSRPELWFTPARWGFASTASTIDLIRLVPGPLTPQDSHWKHTPGTWWFNMAMLGAICVGYLSFVRWKIRLKGG